MTSRALLAALPAVDPAPTLLHADGHPLLTWHILFIDGVATMHGAGAGCRATGGLEVVAHVDRDGVGLFAQLSGRNVDAECVLSLIAHEVANIAKGDA